MLTWACSSAAISAASCPASREVPPRAKKSSSAPTSARPDQPGHDRGQRALGRRALRHGHLGQAGVGPARRRQGGTVDLAVGVEREPAHGLDGGGH